MYFYTEQLPPPIINCAICSIIPFHECVTFCTVCQNGHKYAPQYKNHSCNNFCKLCIKSNHNTTNHICKLCGSNLKHSISECVRFNQKHCAFCGKTGHLTTEHICSQCKSSDISYNHYCVKCPNILCGKKYKQGSRTTIAVL